MNEKLIVFARRPISHMMANRDLPWTVGTRENDIEE